MSKILIYGNGGMCPTGFGVVLKEIFCNLHAQGVVAADDVSWTAINFYGGPHDLPFRNVWPAAVAGMQDGDLFGRARFANMVLGGAYQFDVLFLLEDHFTLSWPVMMPDGRVDAFMPGLISRLRQQVAEGKRPPFKVVQYIPIDSETLRPEWITWITDLVDFPVAYTPFGARVMTELDARIAYKLRVIPHGTNPEVFFPISAEERAQYRQQWFQCGPDDPLIMNVNRNQPRKDIPRTLQVFKEVLREVPNAKLYLHMNARDFAGFDLERVRLNLRIPNGKVIFPGGFSEGQGVPLNVLNAIMNCADVMVQTARGEGWSLTVSDAMTIGVPFVAPDHTSLHDLLTDGRGVLVPPDPIQHIITQDNDQLRPVADVPAMAKAIVDVLRDKPAAKAMGATARQWALANTWKSHVAPQWAAVLREAEASLRPAPAVGAIPRRMVLNARVMEQAA